MIDRKVFFDSIRVSLFAGKLIQKQVSGITAILDEWEKQELTDLPHLAYMLATTYHETARTMQPIAEYGKGRGRKYGQKDQVTGQVYYGRGFVQLTWKFNYITMSKVCDCDLVNNPDLALELKTATEILFYGMKHGSFTGKKLSDYFNTKTTDPINARRIINGTDKAKLIARYYNDFFNALWQS